MSSNDQSSLLSQIARQLNRLEDKQDTQSEQLTEIRLQTLKTNGRVTGLEGRAKILEQIKGKKVSFPPQLLYILAISGVLALGIIATKLGIDIKALGL